MKKFLLKVALFFVIILVVDVCFGYAFDSLRRNARGGDTKAFENVCSAEPYDVLIMGSSRARHHYVSRMIQDSLGLRTMNIGQEANGIILMYALYSNLSRYYTPKYIIYDLGPYDLYENAGGGDNLKYLAPIKPYSNQNSFAKFFRDYSLTESLKVKSSLYRYNTTFFHVLTDNLRETSFPLDGYYPVYGVLSYEPEADAPNQRKYDEQKLYYWQKLVDETTSKGTQLIVALSPKYLEGESSQFDVFSSLDNAENVLYINHYNDSSFVGHRELFQDPVHMNNNGACLYTKKVIDEMMMNL